MSKKTLEDELAELASPGGGVDVLPGQPVATCDRCGHAVLAKQVVTAPDGYVWTFCQHHFNEHWPKLRAAGATRTAVEHRTAPNPVDDRRGGPVSAAGLPSPSRGRWGRLSPSELRLWFLVRLDRFDARFGSIETRLGATPGAVIVGFFVTFAVVILSGIFAVHVAVMHPLPADQQSRNAALVAAAAAWAMVAGSVLTMLVAGCKILHPKPRWSGLRTEICWLSFFVTAGWVLALGSVLARVTG